MENKRSGMVNMVVVMILLQETWFLYINVMQSNYAMSIFSIIYLYVAFGIFQLKDAIRKQFIIYQIMVVVGKLLAAHHSATFSKLAVQPAFNWESFSWTLCLPLGGVKIFNEFYLPIPIFINLFYILCLMQPKVKEQFK